MISVFKGLQEKETNYDYNDLITNCLKTVEPSGEWNEKTEWWKAEPLPTIPESGKRHKLLGPSIGTNVLRHNAMIFDLEPNDYVIVICAAPTVSARNFLIACIDIHIRGKN